MLATLASIVCPCLKINKEQGCHDSKSVASRKWSAPSLYLSRLRFPGWSKNHLSHICFLYNFFSFARARYLKKPVSARLPRNNKCFIIFIYAYAYNDVTCRMRLQPHPFWLYIYKRFRIQNVPRSPDRPSDTSVLNFLKASREKRKRSLINNRL